MFVLKLYITDHSRYLIVFFINIFWTLIMSLTFMLDFGKTHWWLVRVTLVVAFGFLPNNFGRYRSGTVNSKSFVGKVLLRIKRKFELTYAL